MTWSGEDHSFVICAYGESPYLEECILSLRRQSVRSAVMLATSTPNELIRSLSSRYGLPLFVSGREPGLAGDWNFALGCADTPLVTLAHQDDVYLPEYTGTMLSAMNRAREPLLFSSGYGELREGETLTSSKLLNIKKLLRTPMALFPYPRWSRRLSLAFGDPICCPSVTFVRDRALEHPFDDSFACDLDWAEWETLSRERGSFAFSPRTLVLHRIHPASETSRILADHRRSAEDYRLFCRFWPERIARRLTALYAASEKSNEL